jgi:phosphonoacetaldehyde hydrolase
MEITTVILDWAGTTVDFGCFAPVEAFKTAFEIYGLSPTMEETRAPMGMQKRAHIEAMLLNDRMRTAFKWRYGRNWTGEDVDNLYHEFEPALFQVLTGHCEVMPGVVKTAAVLHGMGIKIGSTTGYTAAMMEIVIREARKAGYAPDALVCPDETGGIGRPYPYMLHRNLEKLGEMDVRRVLKLGDTEADIREGKNAGCISVGAIRGSSILGLTKAEYEALTGTDHTRRMEKARAEFLAAGADYVIDSIEALPELIETLKVEG